MADIENQVMTRVRLGGQYSDRLTKNVVWGEFVHLTTRPVGGIPDPHAHVHAWMANCTFDPVEQRWKAAKIRDFVRDSPLHRAAFHARLAKRVTELGYEVRRSRHGWEIAGISREFIEVFSRRSGVIEREASRLGISDPGAEGQARRSHP